MASTQASSGSNPRQKKRAAALKRNLVRRKVAVHRLPFTVDRSPFTAVKAPVPSAETSDVTNQHQRLEDQKNTARPTVNGER
jgi:hypothetical protein